MKFFLPRLFVRHTRRCAGSGHPVKAMPCRVASRALTGWPCFPAMDTCGRRTRKPPAGVQSKEAPGRKHKAATQKSVSHRSRFSRIPLSRSSDVYPMPLSYLPDVRRIQLRFMPDARIMRTCFCTDACSFVRRYPAGPAYVSSIRYAYSLTAGEGRRPFEPRKPKDRESGEGARME